MCYNKTTELALNPILIELVSLESFEKEIKVILLLITNQ